MNEDFELCLNHISADEAIRNNDLTEEYKQDVRILLRNTDRVFPESHFLKGFKKMTMEKLMKQSPDQYQKAGFVIDANKKKVVGWMDFYDTYFIQPHDTLYDKFFLYKTRGIDLNDLDDFLDYHLEKTFTKAFTKFSRFLKLTMRKYRKRILDAKYSNTVNEWIEIKKEVVTNPKTTKRNPKVKREDGHGYGYTSLNQKLTSLLIHFLKKGRIIIDDGTLLSDTAAGEAFSILTGYNSDTIRTSLSLDEIDRIKSKKNLEELLKQITKVTSLIESDIKGKK